MKAYAQALDLIDDPGRIAEYVDWHHRVFPEVLRGLRALGLMNMKIFLHGVRLFMYFEAPDDFDPKTSYQSYAQSPRAQEWDAMMRRYQRPVPGADPGLWWQPMRCVFDLETAR